MYVETYYSPLTTEDEEKAHTLLADAIAKKQAQLALAERLVCILQPIAHHAQANAKMCKLAEKAGLRAWGGDYYGKNAYRFRDLESNAAVDLFMDKGASMADVLQKLMLMEYERQALAHLLAQQTHLSAIREAELQIRKLAADIDKLRDKVRADYGYLQDDIQRIFVGICKTSH